MEAHKKDTALEALRGIAAISVVLGHGWVAFNGPGIYIPQLLHLFLNGSGAVVFFFVLSGHVLTKRFVQTENFRSLANSVIKRWFRLLGPVCLSFLLSAALFKLNLFYYQPAAEILKSPWLSMFGYAIPPNIGFRPSFHDAFVQGSFYVFFVQGHQYYNSPLGTMYFEAIGSFLIFGLAFLAVLLRRFSFWLSMIFLIASGIYSNYFNPYYTAFVVGLGLTLVLDGKWRKLPSPVAAIFILTAIYLFGNSGMTYGIYAWTANFAQDPNAATYFWIFAAILLILGVENYSGTRNVLSSRIGKALGDLSFPIYLVHFLVLCSIGCYVWINLFRTYGREVAALAVPVTFVGSVIFAIPFIIFDRWWTANVNRIAAAIIPIKKESIAQR